MINVGHLMKDYLGQSETFVWQYLHAFKEIHPVVLAYSLKNLSQFPLPNGRIRLLSGHRGSLPWIMDNFYKRLWNKPFGLAERIIRKEKIDLLHAHSGFYGAHFLPLLENLSLPFVTTFYGMDLSRNDVITAYKNEYRDLFERGQLFLVEGNHMKMQLMELGCPENKIGIQRIAIDLRNYDFRGRTWDSKRPVRFLFIGRFVEKKGLEFALKALAIIKEIFPIDFHIIGDGDLLDEMQCLSRELELTNYLHWHGMLPHHRVIEEIKKCDILIQPSVTAQDGDSEGGAPTVLLEAQACGVPIVSTTHADIPNITVPGRSALLSPERDVSSLADNVRFLLEHPDQWTIMGKHGRAYIERYHDVEMEVVALTDKYRKLLHGGKL